VSRWGQTPTGRTGGIVATSQPTATLAGRRALERGGNAADAALAAAAVLCVSEPMMTGVGGDAFAIVWKDGRAYGLDAAGPAPADAVAGEPVDADGPRSVTVPGAVGGWAALASRFGRLGLADCLSDAIALAEDGFEVQPVCARLWAEAAVAPFGPPPAAGSVVRFPELAETLRRIGGDPRSFYTDGRIADACWLAPSDLASYEARWVEPLAGRYRDLDVLEMPDPTQGAIALHALQMLEEGEATFAARVECAHRAMAQGLVNLSGDTVYLCAVDEDGMAVSFIQSLFAAFGSGVTVPGTGVVLHNRGACFNVSGGVRPGRRPFHTIIPGLLVRDGALVGPFGLMGGFIQAQSHMQFVSNVIDYGMTPQEALDAPRFFVVGDDVLLEEGLADRADEVAAMGLRPVAEEGPGPFGAGQAILDGVGGSDRRRDGFVAG
jgi:gamma-glutamyltranspeptidase/glutathione hydrolase